MTDDAPLSFSQVFKRQGRTQVLRNLNFSVQEGEFVGLVGLNGAGKTTVFKSLLDLITIDSGSIRLFSSPHHDARARRRIAYLPERFMPPAHLYGSDFLNFMLRINGKSTASTPVEHTLRALDFPYEKLRTPIRTYSKGTAQKLGLAACVLSGKALLVLDEPMSGLDPAARYILRDLLLHLKRDGKTLLMSSHSLNDVRLTCDRVLVLHEGEIRFDGPPQSLLEKFETNDGDQAFVRCIQAEKNVATSSAAGN